MHTLRVSRDERDMRKIQHSAMSLPAWTPPRIDWHHETPHTEEKGAAILEVRIDDRWEKKKLSVEIIIIQIMQRLRDDDQASKEAYALFEHSVRCEW